MLRYITFTYTYLTDMLKRLLSRNSLAAAVVATAFVVLASEGIMAQDSVAVMADPVLESVTMPADTVFNPNIVYTTTPRIYEIAGITVDGAPNYQREVVVGYSGLRVGSRIEIPGKDITDAAKRLWDQGLFANVQILVDKFVGDKVWLRLNLRQQPRIGTINFHGVKKGEQKDLEDRLKLMKGNQITPNIVNRAKQIIKKYFDEKGFPNANVTISTAEDISEPNYMKIGRAHV